MIEHIFKKGKIVRFCVRYNIKNGNKHTTYIDHCNWLNDNQDMSSVPAI